MNDHPITTVIHQLNVITRRRASRFKNHIHDALRLSKNAPIPSAASSVSQRVLSASMVISMVPSSMRGPNLRANALAAATAPGAQDKYGTTSASTASANCAAGTARASNPSYTASAASNMRDDMKTRRALPSPIREIT